VKNALVVGPPRSGTSLTAAVFARNGYYVGAMAKAAVREGDDYNPFGYFEADDLIERNVALLQRAGFPFHNTWKFEAISEETIARIPELPPSDEDRRLVASYEARSPWLWKDPRLCFTLGYWWKLLDPAQTAVFLIDRDPEQTLHSFRRVGWGAGERDVMLQRIRRHARAAAEAVESLHIPHLAVLYEDYLRRPEEVARRINDLFGLKLRPEDLNVRRDLSHATLRGRVSGWFRQTLDTGAMQRLRGLKRVVPRPLLHAVFPEKKYRRPDR
jgi:hypothetical protein